MLDSVPVGATSAEDAKLFGALSLWTELALSKDNPAAFDTAGDINQRPISLWFVRGLSGLKAAYILGHADGACCPLVSKAVLEASESEGFAVSWHSFGVGVLQANGRDDGPRALEELRTRVTGFATESACAGQIRITMLDDDTIATDSERIAAATRKAYQAAVDVERPVFVWHDFEKPHPALVAPELRRGRKSEPLVIELSEDDFAFPPSLRRSVSLAGLGQYIASIRSEIQHLRDVQEMLPLLRRLGDGRLGWSGYKRTSEFCEQQQLAAADMQLAELRERHKAMLQILETLGRNNNNAREEYRPSVAKLKDNLVMLDGYLETNSRAAAGSSCTWIDIHPAGEDDGFAQALRDVLTMYEGEDLSRKLAELTELLYEVETRRERPPSDPVPALVDAALRGWPATFSAPDAEEAFDTWLREHQEDLWAKIGAQLARRGVKLRAGDEASPMGFLSRSNVVFRVEHVGKRVRVKPYFVLAGSFYAVADPGAGVIRYESAVADQNLLSIPE
ncbi:hypothetical protein OV203_20365 [Nannocystis sp. ILAH1]|uniref:hypothetical protein n=1 Tax=Nannocystis sp. ILAH1 TaxID=2996789 RepID=UPI00226F6556|nr:hypothetical protein [Nannocystis sp. ILAH1]MCY0989506.1 hypothetical protein [Nannocystis sp. ILAH1]